MSTTTIFLLVMLLIGSAVAFLTFNSERLIACLEKRISDNAKRKQ